MIFFSDEEDLALDLLLVFVVSEFLVEVDSFDDEFFGLLFDNYKFTDINLNIGDYYSLILDPEGVEFLQPLLQLQSVGDGNLCKFILGMKVYKSNELY